MRAEWVEANRRHLMAALALLRCYLTRDTDEATNAAHAVLSAVERELSVPPMIERAAKMFGLSSFERDVLLLCAGVELDTACAAACAAAHGDPRATRPTFGLALARLPNAHWSAVGPASPLRHHRLIEVGAGDILTSSPLRIDERLLHWLVGVDQPDERLAGILERVGSQASLVASHRAIAEKIVRGWERAAPLGELPVVELCGPERSAKEAIALAVSKALGLSLEVLAPNAAGANLDDPHLVRLITREAKLGPSALLINAEDLDERSEPSRGSALCRFVDRLPGPVLVATRDRLHLSRRATNVFEISRPTQDEQRALWREALSARASAQDDLDAVITPLVATFDFSAPSIRAASSEDAASLWEACRKQARPSLDDLAARIEPRAAWDALVLPAEDRATLREIAIHVRRRDRVYRDWGFAKSEARGLGVSALFAGPSGTGKTLAAEVLASELGLDLYRVDLSRVVSKYIGDTEKHLRRIFDAAEEGSAVLLFDEADALFGRRTRVASSHDRHSNVEVAYLLQRMEVFRGLSILTTNLAEEIDQAFSRRLRFTVHFPFPSEGTRAEIWRRVFPKEAPIEGIDFEKLARWNLTGGSIRTIALGAAFLAAEEGSPVRMDHVSAAARAEYKKLGRSLPEH